MARVLVTEDGVLEVKSACGSDYDSGFGSMGSKKSCHVYHWDLVTSTNEGKEEHFDCTRF